MVLQRILNHDALRVGDEEGKGSELLRQQVNPHVGNNTYVMLLAEVDCIIRTAYVTIVTNNPTTGHVTIQKRTPGISGTVEIASMTDIHGDLHDIYELEIDGERHVKRGEIVEMSVLNSNNATRLSLHLSWMPDLWNDNANPRSYSLID